MSVQWACTIIVVAVNLLLTIGLSIAPHASALQQVAGKVELVLAPGETRTFRWGLVSDIDEAAELGLRAEGAGSEFIALPRMVDLAAKGSVYVAVNVTIPAEHPGGITLKPVVYATQFGKPGGPTIINLQMQKALTVTIEPNPDASFRTLEVKSFVQEVTIGG